jgi:ribosome-associated protein
MSQADPWDWHTPVRRSEGRVDKLPKDGGPDRAEPGGTPQPEDVIVINADLAIPAVELRYRFSRSGGPGGQHVNRTETRVELLFDVAHSPSLTEDQRARILNRLPGYIDQEGILRIVSSATRSQLDNRADATARFQALLQAALVRRKHRIPTHPSAAARGRRLDRKRVRAGVKQARRPPRAFDDF